MCVYIYTYTHVQAFPRILGYPCVSLCLHILQDNALVPSCDNASCARDPSGLSADWKGKAMK